MREDLVILGAERKGVRCGAILSADSQYRYLLSRRWGDGDEVLFIMLNPSTADHEQDDNTIRVCTSFAKHWGAGGLQVCNLMALRSTDPTGLYGARDPVGPLNDEYIERYAITADRVIVAWGNHAARGSRFYERARLVMMLLGRYKITPYHLGLTALDAPRHPLRISLKTIPAAFSL